MFKQALEKAQGFLIPERVIHFFLSQPGQITHMVYVSFGFYSESATQTITVQVEDFDDVAFKKTVPGWLPVTFP